MNWVLNAKELIGATKGQVLTGQSTESFLGVSTNSRTKQKDHVFFAIKGSNFDAHDFLQQSLDNGATAFVLDNTEKTQNFLKQLKKLKKEPLVIEVPDCTKALGELALFWRKKLGIKILAITGSNGKTTTKKFTKTILSDLSAYSSYKSYNNHWGVPLSILSVAQKDHFLIQEIGTNSPGEIASLTKLCQPFACAVTTVGMSHLEGLGSIENIAKEKQQIYLDSSSERAIKIFNLDNPYTLDMAQTFKDSKNMISFSKDNKQANVCLQFTEESFQSSKITGTINGVSSQSSVQFFGSHNLENLMCACALALSAGVSPQKIWSKISRCELPAGRQELFYIFDKRASIFFDAYNANPTSMHVFLKNCELAKASKTAFVLGDMKELGDQAIASHEQLSRYSLLINSSFIWFVGEYADLVESCLSKFGFKGNFFKTSEYKGQHLQEIKTILKQDCLLGIKASRSLHLEQLFFDLTGIDIFKQEESTSF